MPSRRVVLVANRQGPPAAIKGVENPIFRVRGVEDGVLVKAVLLNEHDVLIGVHEFRGSGNFPIPEAVWILASCENPTRSTICDVVSEKVA